MFIKQRKLRGADEKRVKKGLWISLPFAWCISVGRFWFPGIPPTQDSSWGFLSCVKFHLALSSTRKDCLSYLPMCLLQSFALLISSVTAAPVLQVLGKSRKEAALPLPPVTSTWPKAAHRRPKRGSFPPFAFPPFARSIHLQRNITYSTQ